MSYSVKHDTALDLVEITFRGVVSGSDLRESTTEGVALQKRTGVARFLIDADESQVRASFVDILELPEKEYPDGDVSRKSRIAVILPDSASARDAADFYEIACQNRGWNARVFPDRQSAIDWLTGAGRPDTA